MGMGVGMLKWERWPERYKGGVKFVTADEAIEWTREMDKRGFVHLLICALAHLISGGFASVTTLTATPSGWQSISVPRQH